MTKTKQSEDDKFVKRTIEHNISASNSVVNRIKELNNINDFLDYAESKYIDPYNLIGSPIVKEFSSLLESNKIKSTKDIDKIFEKYLKQHTKEPPLKKNKGLIEDIESHPKHPKTKKHSTSDSILKTIFDIKEDNKPKYKNHKTSESLINTLFDVAEKTMKFKHDKKFDTTEAEELFKKIEGLIKANKPVRKDMVDRMAQNIIDYPMYKGITKTKLKKYGFDIFNKFNKRYPELMNEMFKKEEIENLLKKKYDKAIKVGNIKK